MLHLVRIFLMKCLTVTNCDSKDASSLQRRSLSDGNAVSRRSSNAVMLSRRPSRPSPLAGPVLSSQEDGEEQNAHLSKANVERASSVGMSRGISRRASMPLSNLVTESGRGAGDQRPSDRHANNVGETATARKQPRRVIYIDDLKRNQRPHSAADTLPTTYRPLSPSRPLQPRPVSDHLVSMSVPQASQSKGLYYSSSMNIMDDSNSSMRTPMDIYSGAPSQSTITLLNSPPASRAESLSRGSYTSVLNSANSSLRTLADVDSGVPSPGHLRVPTLDRRHSLMLPSRRENKPEPSSHMASRPQSSSASWSSSMTPTFTRQGLAGAGVVLPLTVKEYQRQQKMKEREGKLTGNGPSFLGMPRLRPRPARRHSDAGYARAPSIRSKRGSIYVLPSVASVFSAEVIRDEGEEDAKVHDGITGLGTMVEDLVQAFEKTSTDAQDHVDDCKRDEGGTMVTIENPQPPPTEAKKHRTGPVGACRRYLTAIFVRRPKPGSSEISGEGTGSKAHAHASRTIKAIFSNNIIRK